MLCPHGTAKKQGVGEQGPPRSSPRSSYFPSNGGDGCYRCPQALHEPARDALGVSSFAETAGERTTAWAYPPPGFCWKNIRKFSRSCQYLGVMTEKAATISPHGACGQSARMVGMGSGLGREGGVLQVSDKKGSVFSLSTAAHQYLRNRHQEEGTAWDSHQTHPIW